MLYETEHEQLFAAPAPPTFAPLPEALALTEHCAAMLRAYLASAKLDHWRIFQCGDHELWDIDRHLHAIEEDATWEPLPPLLRDGEPAEVLTLGQDVHIWSGGTLHLRHHHVVIARWYWIDLHHSRSTCTLYLHAAAAPRHFAELRKKIAERRRIASQGMWQIVRGYSGSDLLSIPRVAPDCLFLPDEIRRSVDGQLAKFFSDDVKKMYQSLGVPYRRGVLLHGPPGNGKTSLIRHIAAQLPHVPAMILRPMESFDSDDLEEVVRRWTAQAPAILVIEDLNWLLEKVNVSTFLNLIDGIEATVTGGLMLIATSNHPQQLDSAINNRPGRFDVVIEIPPPAEAMRKRFFTSKLLHVDAAMVDRLVTTTEGLSFAHLQEVLRLSGLSAIHQERAQRSDDDLLAAAAAVRRASDDAERGFPSQQEMPFGLMPMLQRKR